MKIIDIKAVTYRFPIFLGLTILVFSSVSCTKKKSEQKDGTLMELRSVQKSHTWYYFTQDGFEKCDLPQKAPAVPEKPWTEAVRISSAGNVPSTEGGANSYQAYALVNHGGILAVKNDGVEFFKDRSIFTSETADSLVFSKGVPIFYLYKSTFFNQLQEPFSQTAEPAQKPTHRPFLVEFNPSAKLFFPLVSYENLHLAREDQVTGYVWNGKTWACSAKRKPDANRFEFSYFTWEPYVQLSELSPALNTEDMLLFKPSTEDEYKKLILPKLYNSAPEKVKELLSPIPSEFPFYLIWRDESGTTPLSYYQSGNGASPVSAHGIEAPLAGYVACVFADGTTYIKKTAADSQTVAFRLPLMPAGYNYGEVAIAGNYLYVAWEQTIFYKTGRSGFISVNLEDVLAQATAAKDKKQD